MDLFPVMVFEGGEVPSEDDGNKFLMSAWTVEEAQRVFGEFMGSDVWAVEKIEWCDPMTPTTLGETVMFIGPNLVTAAKCGIDGGQLYIVRM